MYRSPRSASSRTRDRTRSATRPVPPLEPREVLGPVERVCGEVPVDVEVRQPQVARDRAARPQEIGGCRPDTAPARLALRPRPASACASRSSRTSTLTCTRSRRSSLRSRARRPTPCGASAISSATARGRTAVARRSRTRLGVALREPRSRRAGRDRPRGFRARCRPRRRVDADGPLRRRPYVPRGTVHRRRARTA